MKIKELVNILDKLFPPKYAVEGDSIGMQIDPKKDDIKIVMVTLDITIDTIYEAILKKVDLIISHHSLFFGKKEEVLKQDKYINNKFKILEKMEIGVFIIHTNSDHNKQSIAHSMALAFEFDEITQIKNNFAVKATVNKEMDSFQLINYIKTALNINYKFRTNIFDVSLVKHVIIGSGASADLIFDSNLWDKIFVIGELKHHHWVFANENNIKVIETGHFSEYIFKDMVKVFLDDYKNEITIIKSSEKNGYKNF